MSNCSHDWELDVHETYICSRCGKWFTEWAASHIRDLEAKLAQARELPGKWRSRLFDSRTNGLKGLVDCADELEAALQSAAGPGGNQPELDNTKSEG